MRSCRARLGWLVSAALAGAVALGFPPTAAGWVLAEDELAERSTELGLLARTFAFVLEPLPSLRSDPTTRMLGLIDETQGQGIVDLRLSFSHKTPRAKLVLHNQLTLTATSMTTPGGAVALGRGVDPPRWLPLQWTLTDQEGLQVRNTVDWVYAAVTWGPAVISVGRQPVTFGRGKLWQPMDVISTFALTEVDTEFKPGVDAVRVELSPLQRTFVTVVATAGELRDELSLSRSCFALRAKQGWSSGELGLLGGYVRRDGVIGADAVFDTGSFDLYAETTVTMPTEASLTPRWPETGRAVVRGLVGATFKPASKLTLTPEIFFNGFGRWEPEDYLRVALSERVGIGESFNLGMLYLAGIASWEVHPLVNLTGGAILNPRDPSGLVILGATLSAAANIQLRAGAYLPVGETPEVGPPDPALGLPTIRPNSEFGLYPLFFFVELKAAV